MTTARARQQDRLRWLRAPLHVLSTRSWNHSEITIAKRYVQISHNSIPDLCHEGKPYEGKGRVEDETFQHGSTEQARHQRIAWFGEDPLAPPRARRSPPRIVCVEMRETKNPNNRHAWKPNQQRRLRPLQEGRDRRSVNRSSRHCELQTRGHDELMFTALSRSIVRPRMRSPKFRGRYCGGSSGQTSPALATK